MLVMTNYVYPPLSMMNIDLERTSFVKCTDILGDKIFSVNTEYCMPHLVSVMTYIITTYMKHEYLKACGSGLR